MAELLTRPFVFYLVFFVLFLIRTDTNKNYENETKNLLCTLTKIFTDKDQVQPLRILAKTNLIKIHSL